MYGSNGDNEIRFSPGVMYEGRIFALEFMMQFPFIHDLDHRAELDISVGIGLRVTL